MAVRSLPKAASDLSKFLKQDLAKVWQQHLGSTAGEDWLYIATYLDPRFKKMSYCNGDRMEKTRKMVTELCMTVAEKYPQLQHPENRPLVALLHDDVVKDHATAAIEAGFADQPHMNRQFRQVFDSTPEQMR